MTQNQSITPSPRAVEPANQRAGCIKYPAPQCASLEHSRRLVAPAGFLWGAATAAHQVEGQNLNNDWWEWEQTGGKIKANDSSLVACDWWGGRYSDDFQRACALGQNSHRLSLEWSRLEPREGEWDSSALDVYRSMLSTLREHGLTPMVTLHHFTNPLWLAAKGGWENPAVVNHFAGYAARVVKELGDLCNFWITFNEPNGYATLSYCAGLWPPQKRGIAAGMRVVNHMVRAHAVAYHAMKEIQPLSQIGVAHHFRAFLPESSGSTLDRAAARLRDYLFNWVFFDALESGGLHSPFPGGREATDSRGTQDFIGVNYYFSERTAFDVRLANTMFARRELDQEALDCEPTFAGVANIDPGSFETLLTLLARYQKPIYITENGIFETDASRDTASSRAHGGAAGLEPATDNQSRYLVAHVAAMQRAMQAGVDVRGYYWWTLVDNFEWSEGYSPRFGLYQLDRATQTRTAKPVAAVYAQIIRENGISPELMAQYVGPIRA
jgi:beta-glucosidase